MAELVDAVPAAPEPCCPEPCGPEAVEALLATMPCRCAKCGADGLVVREATRGEASRFLVGPGGGDVGKAAHVLTKCLRWRARCGADDLLRLAVSGSDGSAGDEATLALERRVDALYPAVVHGLDAPGGACAVVIQCVGRARVAELLDDVGVDAVVRVSTLRHERAMALRERRVVVMDMAGLAPGALRGLAVFRELIDIMQRNYPETVDHIFVINAPLLVHATYRVVRPWLDPVTERKVRIFGARDAAGMRAGLLAAVHPAHLPRSYGGDCRCAFCSRVLAAEVAASEVRLG